MVGMGRSGDRELEPPVQSVSVTVGSPRQDDVAPALRSTIFTEHLLHTRQCHDWECLHDNFSKTVTKIQYREEAKQEVGRSDLAVGDMTQLGKRIQGGKPPTSQN